MQNLTSRQVSRRRSYILIVILGFAAVVTTLGLAFLDSHSTAMPEAVNAYGAVRAQYLAESGAAIANHFLMYPPTTVSACGYWTGANNIAVDTTNDYTNVSVVQDAGNTDTFTITAVGVALNPDGSVRGKRTITAKVIRPAGRKVKMRHGLLANAGAIGGNSFGIPYNNPPIKVYGDVHAEGGSLWSCGWCQGKVSASTTACWTDCGGAGPPASTTSNAAAVALPIISPTNYQSYTVNGTTYSALSTSNGDWDEWTGATISWLLDSDMEGNPGRVVYRSGNLKLRTNFNVNCTLAITGALTIEGTGVKVTAVENYPAVVLSGNLMYGADGSNASFTGAVLVSGTIKDSNKSGVGLSVTGACYAKKGLDLGKSNGTYVFTYDCNRAIFWDFSLVTDSETPITILSWKEN